LSSVSIGFLKQLFRSFRNSGVELLQILDLSQEPDENGVKVNFQESIFLVLWALILADQGFLQLVMSAFINLFFPADEL
jgi:hypothetical protein